ncbi:5853_t:CDS:2, partial [Gigaspora margarita]
DKQRENTGCPPQGCTGISFENDQDQNKFVAGVKNNQQSNPKSPFLGLKDIECLEIELIQRQQFNNKLRWNRQTNNWWNKQKNSSIISRIIELMSIKDLEVELNKIEGHSGNKWNNLSIDPLEELPIGQPYKKNALDYQRTHNRNIIALYQLDPRSRKQSNKY